MTNIFVVSQHFQQQNMKLLYKCQTFSDDTTCNLTINNGNCYGNVLLFIKKYRNGIRYFFQRILSNRSITVKVIDTFEKWNTVTVLVILLNFVEKYFEKQK